jgi:hypothetical protein
MSASLKSRVKRIERDLALNDESEITPLIFMIVASREQVRALDQLPHKLPVRIPDEAIVNSTIQAEDYLRWAREQFPEVFQQQI